ncbi:endoglucanase type k [Zalerion maritima]|uniref:Cellulase n=1 Tax=Zalerion maritima TaxID=339359 RepID=A0AAD5WVC3_9PEZI|nr:endoglucanase type k [Zalerion maritima]
MVAQSTLALGLAVGGAYAASGSGVSTRYWDCCKPSCAWPDKAPVSQPVYACDANNNFISNAEATSGCESGGTAYTCANNSPWAISDALSYGFAATSISGGTEDSWCCACYAVTFTTGKAVGKQIVVQSTNTGGDLGSNHFDFLMPGGGLGIFDGCTSQFGGIAGAQYGGISSREECEDMPDALKDGCYWRFDWFMNADNPDLEFEQVQCPDELVERTGCRRDDDGSFPVFVAPDPTWEAPVPTETADEYGQCDSVTWTVAKACPAGFVCEMQTEYWWQCVVGTATTTATSSASAGSGSSTTTSGSTSTTSSSSSDCAAKWGQCGGIGWTGPTLAELAVVKRDLL